MIETVIEIEDIVIGDQHKAHADTQPHCYRASLSSLQAKPRFLPNHTKGNSVSSSLEWGRYRVVVGEERDDFSDVEDCARHKLLEGHREQEGPLHRSRALLSGHVNLQKQWWVGRQVMRITYSDDPQTKPEKVLKVGKV